MGDRYAGVLFDLFGTLIRFDASALPECTLDGRRVRSTIAVWAPLLDRLLPGVTAARLWDALVGVSAELDHERKRSQVEYPSRERFRRALLRVGCAAATADETAPVLARAHMQCIAAATRFPPEHARLLDAARKRCGRVAVVTNFDDTAAAFGILAQHGILSQVDVVVVSEAIGLRKPHPALLRVALRDLDVTAGAALMVGDTFAEDVAAAAAAGIDAAWIDARGEGVPAGSAPPRYVVGTLTDLAPIIA